MTRRPSSSEAEPDRTIGDLLRVGLVETVDLEAGKVVVSFGDQTTPPIDWLMIVGDTTVWIPPTQGQQILVVTPEGDVEQAIALNGLPSSAFAPLFLGLKNAIRFADGAQVSYDPEAEQLDIQTPGKVSMTAPGGLTLTGDTKIVGKLDVTDNITTPKTVTGETDVVGGQKSLKGHKHSGGTIAGQTGTPV